MEAGTATRQKFIRNHWGYVYFWIACVVTLIATAWGPSRIHFPVFIEATRKIIQAQPAYGFPYESGYPYASLWLYSPSCALFFFNLFVFLPTILGKLFYLSLSLGVFMSGILVTSQALQPHNDIRRWNGFWLFLSFEAVGALSAYKIEMLTVGLFFWTLWALIRGKEWWAALLLTFTVNWKFQGVPVAGLLVLAESVRTHSLRFSAKFLGVLLVYSFLPFLFLPWNYLIEAHRTWSSSLNESMVTTWTTYQHIYATLLNLKWVSLTLAQVQGISAVIGLGMAVLVVLFSRRSETDLDSRVLALFCGSAYVVLFSPMSQSLGYILWTPLLWAAWGLFQKSKDRKTIWMWVLGISIFIASISYSDLTPQPLRGWARQYGVKPIGVLILLLALLREQIFRHRTSKA